METLVALSLLGIALLLILSLILLEPQAQRRIGAHTEVLRLLEVILEGIRAGQSVPPGRRVVDVSSLAAAQEMLALDLRVWTERRDESPSGLYRLTLTARYRVADRWFDRSVETRVWTPP